MNKQLIFIQLALRAEQPAEKSKRYLPALVWNGASIIFFGVKYIKFCDGNALHSSEIFHFLQQEKFWNFWTMFFLCVFLEVQMQKNHKSLLWPPIIEKQLLLRLWKNVVTTEYFHELSVLTKIPWKRFRISKLTCFKLRVYVPAFSVIIVMYAYIFFS